LAGFSKHKDLKYFLKKIAGIDYVHMLDLAPTKDILDDYKQEEEGRVVCLRRISILFISAQLLTI